MAVHKILYIPLVYMHNVTVVSSSIFLSMILHYYIRTTYINLIDDARLEFLTSVNSFFRSFHSYSSRFYSPITTHSMISRASVETTNYWREKKEIVSSTVILNIGQNSATLDGNISIQIRRNLWDEMPQSSTSRWSRTRTCASSNANVCRYI